MPEMTWEAAIIQVLGQAEEPLHYAQIAERILGAGLRSNAGATPTQTIAATLSQSLRFDPNTPFQRVARGQYILRQGAPPEAAVREEEANAADADPIAETGAVKAFGMFWRREAVRWAPVKPAILGRQTAESVAVNFADQVGVYLLHDRDRVIYVGRAADTLTARLRAHTIDRLEGRWDRFSWFGLRGVTPEGALADEAGQWTHEVVIETMEALLIETLEPPLNRKRGDNLGAAEYLQAEDPGLADEQRQAFIQEMLRRMK